MASTCVKVCRHPTRDCHLFVHHPRLPVEVAVPHPEAVPVVITVTVAFATAVAVAAAVAFAAAAAALSTFPPEHTWLAASATALLVAVEAAFMAVADVCTIICTLFCTPCCTALVAAAALPEDREAGSTVPPEPCRREMPGKHGVAEHLVSRLAGDSAGGGSQTSEQTVEH